MVFPLHVVDVDVNVEKKILLWKSIVKLNNNSSCQYITMRCWDDIGT